MEERVVVMKKKTESSGNKKSNFCGGTRGEPGNELSGVRQWDALHFMEDTDK